MASRFLSLVSSKEPSPLNEGKDSERCDEGESGVMKEEMEVVEEKKLDDVSNEVEGREEREGGTEGRGEEEGFGGFLENAEEEERGEEEEEERESEGVGD